MQEYLRDEKNGKLVNWEGHKESTEDLAKSYKRIGNQGKYYRVLNCGSVLEFKAYKDGSMKLNSASFCKVRLCPMCAWRRSLKIFGQVSKVMDYIEKETEYRYIFVTLTVRNVIGEELTDCLDKLFYAFNKMTKNKAFKALSKGWFRCLEITHNWEDDTYHPHFHMVIAVNKSYFTEHKIYMSQKAWAGMWQACLCVDYEPIVDVRTVKPEGEQKYKKAVAEVAKYTAKAGDYILKPAKEWEHNEKLVEETERLTDEAVKILDMALRERRLVAFGGELRKVHKLLNFDDTEKGDLINTDVEDDIRSDLDYIITVYKWNVGVKKYVKE